MSAKCKEQASVLLAWTRTALKRAIPGSVVCSLWCAHFAAFAGAAPAASTPSQNLLPVAAPTVSLVVLPSEAVHQLNPNPKRYDFGQRRASEPSPIEHTFLLRNDGPTTITLDHLQPSCGCTTALVNDGVPDASGMKVTPGQQIRIHTALASARLSPGPVDKYVSVFVRGLDVPVVILEITGTLQGSVTFSRTILDFGSTQAGSRRAVPLTVSLDRPLLPVGAVPRLVSSNPDVLVERQRQTTAATLAAPLEQSYLVRLAPHPHLGVLTGTLTMVSGDGAQAQPLSTVTLPIAGEIRGDVAATPVAFAFGMVTAGATASQRALLMAVSLRRLRGLQISCPNRFITVSLRAQTAKASHQPVSAAAAVLEVTLSPQTPVGTLETQVVVVTSGGEQLILPVYVYGVKADNLR